LGWWAKEQDGVVGVGALQGAGEMGAVAGQTGLGGDIVHTGYHEGVAAAFDQQMAVASGSQPSSSMRSTQPWASL
jgi:hypothetical protein